MPRKLAILGAALITAFVLGLTLPTVALACGGGGTSAVDVYVECKQTAGGGKAISTPSKPHHVSKKVSHNIRKAGKKTGKSLRRLVQSLGSSPTLKAPKSVRPPSAFSALFDVGAGPIALIAVLIASVVGLLAGTGWRGWRRSRRLAG